MARVENGIFIPYSPFVVGGNGDCSKRSRSSVRCFGSVILLCSWPVAKGYEKETNR